MRARCVIGVSPVVNAISDLICRSVASAGFLGVFGFFDAPEPHATPVGHGHDLSAAHAFSFVRDRTAGFSVICARSRDAKFWAHGRIVADDFVAADLDFCKWLNLL